jgi:hypothetical protein
VARLDYEVEGRTFQVGGFDRVKRQRVKPKTRKSSLERRLHTDAGNVAVSRLIQIHRPLYDILLAEEKVKRGLSPHIHRRDLLPRELARTLLDFQAVEIPESVERGRDFIAERERRSAG